MCRVRLRIDQTLFKQQIELLLCPLARDAHRFAYLGCSQRCVGKGDGTKHLPTCTCQAQGFDQPVAPMQKHTVEAKDCQREMGERFGIGIGFHRSRALVVIDNQFPYLATGCQ